MDFELNRLVFRIVLYIVEWRLSPHFSHHIYQKFPHPAVPYHTLDTMINNNDSIDLIIVKAVQPIHQQQFHIWLNSKKYKYKYSTLQQWYKILNECFEAYDIDILLDDFRNYVAEQLDIDPVHPLLLLDRIMTWPVSQLNMFEQLESKIMLDDVFAQIICKNNGYWFRRLDSFYHIKLADMMDRYPEDIDIMFSQLTPQQRRDPWLFICDAVRSSSMIQLDLTTFIIQQKVLYYSIVLFQHPDHDYFTLIYSSGMDIINVYRKLTTLEAPEYIPDHDHNNYLYIYHIFPDRIELYLEIDVPWSRMTIRQRKHKLELYDKFYKPWLLPVFGSVSR